MLRTIAGLLFLTCPLAANAEDVFTWPEAFTVTDHETVPGSDAPPFVNVVHVSDYGFNTRNDISTPSHGVKVDIFHFEGKEKGYKETVLHTDGTVTEKHFPADWPRSNMFPRGGVWTLLGSDTVNGQPALKYSVVSDPAMVAACKYCSYHKVRHTFAWLSPDKKTPLRFAEDPYMYNAVVDFTDYHVGPQDPKLFEAPHAN